MFRKFIAASVLELALVVGVNGTLLATGHDQASACCSRTPSTKVHGYTKKSGVYVQPYRRTLPDSSRSNNYNSRGNYNPWTGKYGTK